MSSLSTRNGSGQGVVSLTGLAQRINDAHAACEASARTTVENAITCGQALIEAKSKIEHGGWLTWLEENCPRVSTRSSQGYMRLARNAAALESNTQGLSHLGVEDTLKFLAESHASRSTPASRQKRRPRSVRRT